MLNNEKRYLISRFVNLIGNSIYNICIPLYLLEKFESLMITGAFFTLVQIPMVVLLPFIGSFLKNKNLKHTMLASNVISVVIFMMVFINEQFFSSSFILFMILTMLEKINVAIFNISSQSAFPILFEKTDIDEINSLKSVLDNFAALLGPTLGTVIYSKGGFSVIVGINILSFALCFLVLLHLKYIDKCGPSIQNKNKIKDIYEGLIYIKSNSNIMLLFLTFMILNFLVAPTENVFAPAIIKVIYKFSDSLFGLTSTAVSIGVITAGACMSIFKKKSNILYAFYTQSIIMILTGILSLFLRGQPMIFFTIYIILCLLSGYSSTLVNVPVISYFQKNVDIDQQTQFFSIMTLFSNIAVPLGTFVSGIMCELFGGDVAYLMNGIIMFIYVYIMRRDIKMGRFDINIDSLGLLEFVKNEAVTLTKRGMN